MASSSGEGDPADRGWSRSLSVSSHYSNRRKPGADVTIDRRPYTAGQALVTVVNDPRSDVSWWGTLRQDLSWKDPPPAVDQTKYPNIQRHDLERYLRTVSGRYEQFLEDRESLAQGLQQQLLLIEGQGASVAQGDGLVRALQQVPAQYFQEDFSLLRPGTFTSLCDVQEDSETYERIDELSGYLDVVETQLMREIASRSKSVFEAAGVLQELHRSLCATLDHIKGLREAVSEMDEQTYTSAVTVSGLQRRRRNLKEALEQLKAVEEIVASKGALQCLLEAQDYAGALELLENLRHGLDAQLKLGLVAFRQTVPQVDETIDMVESLLCSEFLSLAHYPNMHLVMEMAISEAAALAQAATDAAQEGASGYANGSMDGGMVPLPSFGGLSTDLTATREQLHDKLLPIAVGLFKANKLQGVMQQLRENAAAEVKALIREVLARMVQPLLASAGMDGPAVLDPMLPPDMQLPEQLQMLPHMGFMQVLMVITRIVKACMQHTSELGLLLEEIFKGAKSQPPQLAHLRKDFAAALQAMSDAAQGRWVKLIKARLSVHTRLKLYEFKQLMDMCEAFVALPEQHNVKASGALRTALQEQCRAFLDNLHNRSVMQLQHLLESEQWTAVEVPISFQEIVERLVARCSTIANGHGLKAGVMAHSEDHNTNALNGTRLGESYSPPGETSGRSPAVATNGPAAAAAARQPTAMLFLHGKRFILVNSALMLLKLLDEYISLNDVVPLFGAEIATKTLELLKYFNSQTCQLVLGAGAMKTAGLKSISAKHLALSCQCLHMFMTLLPSLRGALLSLAPEPRRTLLMPDFERLMQDLLLHMDEVHTKLVDIMQDRLQVAARALVQEADAWGSIASSSGSGRGVAAAGGPGGPMPSDCLRNLSKQLNTLRAVLSPILQREEVHYIFGRVASASSDTLAGCLDSLTPRGEAWEAQRKANALYMLQCLYDLPLDTSRASAYLSRLSTFYSKHYGLPPDLNQTPSATSAAPPTGPLQSQQHQQQQQQQQQQQRQHRQAAAAAPAAAAGLHQAPARDQRALQSTGPEHAQQELQQSMQAMAQQLKQPAPAPTPPMPAAPAAPAPPASAAPAGLQQPEPAILPAPLKPQGLNPDTDAASPPPPFQDAAAAPAEAAAPAQPASPPFTESEALQPTAPNTAAQQTLDSASEPIAAVDVSSLAATAAAAAAAAAAVQIPAPMLLAAEAAPMLPTPSTAEPEVQSSATAPATALATDAQLQTFSNLAQVPSDKHSTSAEADADAEAQVADSAGDGVSGLGPSPGENHEPVVPNSGHGLEQPTNGADAPVANVDSDVVPALLQLARSEGALGSKVISLGDDPLGAL